MKKYVYFILILLVASIGCLKAQNFHWMKFGGTVRRDFVGHSVRDKYDNIYVSFNALNADSFCLENDSINFILPAVGIIKIDPLGVINWIKYYYNTQGAGITDMKYDSLIDQIIFTGDFSNSFPMDSITLVSAGYHDAYIAKMDLDGNILWAKNAGSYLEDICWAVDIAPNGDIYFVVMCEGAGSIGGANLQPGGNIVKMDGNGNVIWAKKRFSSSGFPSYYGTTMMIMSMDISNDKLYICGTQANPTTMVDTITLYSGAADNWGMVLSCFDTSGNVQWANLYGMPTSTGYDVESDDLGNLYVLGSASETTHYCNDSVEAAASSSVYILKTDSLGNCLWVNSVRSTSGLSSQESHSWCMSGNHQGQFYITGTFNRQITIGNYSATSVSDTDMFIARIDSDGTWRGLRTFGKAMGNTVVTLSDGSPVVAGTFLGGITVDGTPLSSRGDRDIFIGRLDRFTLAESPNRTANHQLLIYANPNNGTFRFDVPSEFEHEDQLTLIITDLLGREKDRFRLNMNELKEISLTDYASGTYMVRLSNGRKSYDGKMIVE